MNKRFQFRHVNELTGLFVLLILAGAALALFVAAHSQQWFAPKIEYRLKLPPGGAAGLKPGNEIVVLGLPAGIVKDVVVGKNGRLDARIALRRDFAQFVRIDSHALLKKIYGVAGDSFVEISAGSSGEPLQEGATIPCLSSEELPSMVDRFLVEVRGEVLPITQKASALIDEWAKLATNLNSSQVELHAALTRLNQLTANLEAGRGSVGKLLAETNFIAQSERVLTQSQEALAELKTVLQHLKEGTAPLPKISRAVESETRQLPGLVLQVQQTASELERLTEAMQRHWLLRKYVEPRGSSGRIPPEQISGGTPP